MGSLEDARNAQRQGSAEHQRKEMQGKTEVRKLCAEFVALMQRHRTPSVPLFRKGEGIRATGLFGGKKIRIKTYNYECECWIAFPGDRSWIVVTSAAEILEGEYAKGVSRGTDQPDYDDRAKQELIAGRSILVRNTQSYVMESYPDWVGPLLAEKANKLLG